MMPPILWTGLGRDPHPRLCNSGGRERPTGRRWVLGVRREGVPSPLGCNVSGWPQLPDPRAGSGWGGRLCALWGKFLDPGSDEKRGRCARPAARGARRPPGRPSGLPSRPARVRRPRGYSGSLLLVVFSHSRLSSLRAGDGRARRPWNLRHSGQTRMCVQPRATRAASWASLCASWSGSPAPHSLPLLSVAVPRGRRSSGMGGRGGGSPARRRRGWALS